MSLSASIWNAFRIGYQACEEKTKAPPSNRYIEEFVRLRCSPDLLARRVFPNAKEITESFAAYSAAKTLDWSFKDRSINVVVVGDGTTPRTGATFAFRTGWRVTSVDPRLKGTLWNTDRLNCFIGRIEDFQLVSSRPVLIVAVHNHACLTAAVRSIKAPLTACIAIPCCKKQEIRMPNPCPPFYVPVPPDYDFADPGIWSDKNKVLIWKNIP